MRLAVPRSKFITENKHIYPVQNSLQSFPLVVVNRETVQLIKQLIDQIYLSFNNMYKMHETLVQVSNCTN